ncbi:MAG TPA: ABC transporter substrate-binding protein [Micromonosporaceae bacterium]|nr:ABC transporter substrate-binding protein [Micromonosporaceae bacterium]
MQSGQADFAVVDMTGALLEHGRGTFTDLRVFTAIYQRSVSCIMALASRGITVPRDLEGKTVGYTAGGVNKTLFPTYARLAGVNEARIRWVNLPPPQLRPTLLSGKLDAITEIVIGKPAVETADCGPTGAGELRRCREVTMLPYSNYLGDLYGNALATTLSTAMGNPGIVKRFRDAMLKALAYAIGHPKEAGQILAKHQPTYKAEAATAEVQAAEPYVRSGVTIGDVDETRVMQSISLLQGAQAIPDTGLRPEHVVSLELTP